MGSQDSACEESMCTDLPVRQRGESRLKTAPMAADFSMTSLCTTSWVKGMLQLHLLINTARLFPCGFHDHGESPTRGCRGDLDLGAAGAAVGTCSGSA